MPAPQVPVTNGEADVVDVNLAFTEVDANIEAHKSATENPHGTTAAQVGLGNVDNTPDVDKPVSTAQQAALDGKSDNGHGHAVGDVTGLQAALDGKATAAQGAKAESALQQTDLDGHKAAADQHQISGVAGLQDALNEKIEAEALAALTSGGLSMEVRGSLVALKDRDDRVLISFDWNRARQAVQLRGHALSAEVNDRFDDLTFSALAARGVLAQLLGAGGASLLDLMWDRAAQAPRWRGHALSGDVDGAIAHADDLVNTSALAARGVLAALVSDGGASLLNLLWDRATQAPRWDGHALSAEVIGAPKVGDAEVAPGCDARAERQDFVCQTDADGLAWVRLPELSSSAILGVNNSGADLEFRRSWGLPLRGRAYLGDWSPGAVASTSDQGTFLTTLPDPAALDDGVYYEQAAAAGNSVGGVAYAQRAIWLLSRAVRGSNSLRRR